MSGSLQDTKLALRALAQRPAFGMTIIFMLALGIAANTAIFSLFNGLLLKPLPFPDADRIVDIDTTAPQWDLEFVGVSYPDYSIWLDGTEAFESIAVFDSSAVNLAIGADAERVSAALVSHTLDDVLGLEPLMGRSFDASDDREGAAAVTLLSYGLWEKSFAADPGIIGRTVRIDSTPYTVIGVLSRQQIIPMNTDLWIPLSTLSFCCSADEGWGSWWLTGIGQLRAGVTIERAAADLERINAGVAAEQTSREIVTPVVNTLSRRYLGDTRPVVFILVAAVGVLLLIACANIGGLMLARSASRGREIGIRLALGAGRGRIVQQLLTESLVLAAIGGVAGAFLGHAALRWMLTLMPEQTFSWASFELDGRFLAFSFLAAAGSAVIFSLLPSLQVARMDPQGALQEGEGRAATSAGRRRALNGLVVAEIAMAVVLLVGAGLLVQTFRSLQAIDPGFRGDVLTLSVTLPENTYESADSRNEFHGALLDRLRGLSGVEAAGTISQAPLSGHTGYFFQIEGAPESEEGAPTPVVLGRFSSPGYLNTMGLEILQGRDFTNGDGLDEGSSVVIVNETFARTFLDGGEALGRRVRMGGDDDAWLTVVGITRDVKHYGLDEEMRSGVYLPYLADSDGRRAITFALRAAESEEGPSRLAAPVREIVRSIDPDIAIFAIDTMQENLSRSLWTRRSYSILIGGFAAAALVLALGGIYGTVSYAVSQRRREIAIRMALGAREGQVLREVLGEGLRLAGMGAAGGLLLALLGAGAMSSVLLGVSPRAIR